MACSICSAGRGVGVDVGVWVEVEDELGRDLYDKISRAFETGNNNPEEDWPVVSYLSPEGEYWTDLGPFRKKVVNEMKETWERFAPVIDEFFRNSRG